MQVKVNKKVFKTIIAVIIIIAIIVVGVFTSQLITTNIKIKETKEKLSQIDAKELESKLIGKLKDTKLYVEIDEGNIFVDTMFNEGITFKDYITLSYLCIKNGNPIGVVEIPCFRIISDSNGNFKSIEYTEYYFDSDNTIEKTIRNVFKDEYGIEFSMSWGWNEFNGNFNRKYNETFNVDKSTKKGNIYIYDDNFFIGILQKVAGINVFEYGDRVDKELKEYRTTTFGIIEKADSYSNHKREYVEGVNEELKRENFIGENLSVDNNNENTSNQIEIPQNYSSSYDENITDTNEDKSFNNHSTNNFQTSNSGNSNYEQNRGSNNYTSNSSSNGNNDYYGNDNSGSNGNDNYNNQPQQPQEKNIEMPNVVGMSVSQAEQKLNSLGIPYNVSSITSLSKDNVFSQSVPSGTSKPKSQFGTVTLKAYRKVSQVSAYINISSSNYNGQTIKVVVNGKECKDMMGDTTFNGKYSVMTFVNTPNVSVEVYIDNSLVKSQSINVDQISEKNGNSSNEVSTTINI